MQHPWTVSQLTRAISDALATGIGPCRVEGEVSSFTAARSGHWYLDLKDEGAVLSCVFRGRNRMVSQPPRIGDRVVVSGGSMCTLHEDATTWWSGRLHAPAR